MRAGRLALRRMPGERLMDKVALITGAGRGIGEALAQGFAAQGATVVATDRDPDAVAAVVRGIGGVSSSLTHDVTSEPDWDAVVAEVMDAHGRIDALVNNAGIFLIASIGETTLEDYRRVTEVNQVSVFLGMRAVGPAMVKAGAGSIVNVSSIAGLGGTPNLIAYASSKWAVRGMTKVAARELAPHVRVNSIHPGQVDTAMYARAREQDPAATERIVRATPLRRVATPQEVAHAAVFLASDESAFTTGTELVLDGGIGA